MRYIAIAAALIAGTAVAVCLGAEPVTPVEELGRMLYHDSRVSEPNTTSCASCHLIENGTTDGLEKAVGLVGADPINFPKGRIGPRKTMPTLNSGHSDEYVDHFNEPKFWDGRAKNLRDQATGPVENPDEMGNQTKQQMVNRISNIPGYTPLIRAAFGHDRLAVDEFEFAVAKFERRFLTAVDTPAYRYIYKQESDAITEDAKPGAEHFKRHCILCHSGKTFTTGKFANNGFEYVRPSKPMDRGLAKTTANTQSYQEYHERMFKIPTLVAIEMRAPYGHNAFTKELKRVIAHYAAGGSYYSAKNKQTQRDGGTDPRVKKIRMNPQEQAELLVFMTEAFRAYDMPKKEVVVPRKLP